MRRMPLLLIAAMPLALLGLWSLTGCSQGEPPNPSGTFETTVVNIAPVMSGRALAVACHEGDRVSRADTLIVLDTELVRLRRAETEAAQTGLQAQRLVADAELAKARRQLTLFETTLQRTTLLRQQGTATQQQVDDLTAQCDVARRSIDAARGQLAAIDASGLRFDAALAVFDRQIRDGIVVAPIDGTVLSRVLDPGEVAGAGRTALQLSDLSNLELRIFLEAGELDRIGLGQDLTVVADAMPGQPLTGRVSWISAEAEFTPKNAQTRHARAQLVYAVKLRVDNPEGRLHVGMPAEVILP